MSDVDRWRVAGLYDPDAPDADQRRALLAWLEHERGISLDELTDAARRGVLVGYAGDRLLGGQRRYTMAEAAARCGLPPEALAHLHRAAGFAAVEPDAVCFTDDDVAAFAIFNAGGTMFSQSEAMHFVRVVGSSLARIADAAVSLYLRDVEAPLVAAGGTELELARQNAQAIEVLSGLTRVIQVLFHGHVRDAIGRSRAARAGAARSRSASYDTLPMAIGFVDLVGYTPLADQLDVRVLGELVRDFESSAYDDVAEHGGRVVKLIGDAVMFVAVDAEAACRAALSLIHRFAAEGRVTPRGAVAFGELIVRGGDYYGPVVNLASRVAELAVPSELLVTPEVARRATSLRFAPAGRRMPKGFSRPVELLSAEA